MYSQNIQKYSSFSIVFDCCVCLFVCVRAHCLLLLFLSLVGLGRGNFMFASLNFVDVVTSSENMNKHISFEYRKSKPPLMVLLYEVPRSSFSNGFCRYIGTVSIINVSQNSYNAGLFPKSLYSHIRCTPEKFN